MGRRCINVIQMFCVCWVAAYIAAYRGPKSEDIVTEFKHVQTRVTRVSVAINFCEILAPTLIQVPTLVTLQISPGER